jgi:hypothetical protein
MKNKQNSSTSSSHATTKTRFSASDTNNMMKNYENNISFDHESG